MNLWRQKSGAVRNNATSSSGLAAISAVPAILRRVLFISLAITFLFALQRGMAALRDAPIDELKIFGYSGTAMSAQGISEEEVYLLLDAHTDRGFWQLDLAAVQAALESHRWVRRAVVRREWPGTLRVQIDEQLPVARWNTEHVLASSGELVRVKSQVEFANLPQISTPGDGVHSREEIIALVEQYNGLQQMLAPQGLSIRELGSSMGTDIWLIVEGETRIELGERRHIERLARLLSLVESGVIASWESIAHADLRYASGLAVRWRNGAMALPAAVRRQPLSARGEYHFCGGWRGAFTPPRTSTASHTTGECYA
ncbi:MAG: FtsQ-type POTRA domain-containing protein [Pseudomonadales bacterium]